MKRKWIETTAKLYLQARGIEFMGKRIIAKEGFKGLTSCSARDYLVNHCGYIQL